MAGSLIDYAGAIQTVGMLSQMQQNQQRQQLAEQRVDLERQQLEEQRATRIQRQKEHSFQELVKLQKDPALAMNRNFQFNATKAKAELIGMPLPPDTELQGSLDEYNMALNALVSGNADEQKNTMVKLMFASPELARTLIDDAKKVGTFPLELQEVAYKIQANKEKLEQFNQKTAALRLQNDVWTGNLAEMDRVTRTMQDPKFRPHVTALTNLDTEIKRQYYLATHPEFRDEWNKFISQEISVTQPAIEMMTEQYHGKQESLLMHQSVTPDSIAGIELESEVKGYETALNARRAELAFLKDPFSKESQRAYAKAQQDLRIVHSSTQKAISTVADERLKMAQDKEAYKTAMQGAVNTAQVRYAALPFEQQTSQAAARIAKQVESETGVLPSTEDIRKGAKDPNRPSIEVKNILAQETEESKKVGGGYGERFNKLQDAAFSASDTINKLSRMEQLLQGVSTGSLVPAFTELKAIGESLGISLDPKLGAKQAIEALTNKMALDLRSTADGGGMPGAMSDADRAFLRAMPPGLSRTPEGNKLLIETSRKVAQRQIEVAEMAADYRDRKGHFDSGFMKELQQYAKTHPLFDPADMPVPQAPSTTYSDPDKEQRYQEWKKAQGKK